MPERSLAQQDHFGSSWVTLIPPVIADPANMATVSILSALPLTLGTGSVQGGVEQITSTDWEVRTGPNGTGVLVWSTNVSNPLALLSAVVPGVTLALGKTYYIRARQTGQTLGVGPWSADVVVNT